MATVRGDLSTISAPPFLLAPQSLVEFPSYWAERPSLFAAPSLEPDPARRALLVLKLWLSALRRQYYVGAGEDIKSIGLKKPLNPFLGETFIGSWKEGSARTKVISEQVSHHPPTTACYVTSPSHGIQAQAHSTQSTTLIFPSGIPTVQIAQAGHALLHIDAYNEDYLLPLPDVRIKGILTGTLYPELDGTYRLVSSSGYTSEVTFSGKGVIYGGAKNAFSASIYRTSDASKTPRYTASGCWSEVFRFATASGKIIETFDSATASRVALRIPDLPQQGPWESRRAWRGVIDALRRGDYRGVVEEKSRVENAQRALRREERVKGDRWRPEYFRRMAVEGRVDEAIGMGGDEKNEEGQVFRELAGRAGVDGKRLVGSTGVWRFDEGRGRSGRRLWETPLG